LSAADVERARRAYAEKIRGLVGLRSEALFRSLARVPREAFLGPGPWKLMWLTRVGLGYQETPDANPCRLYDNVLVAIDADRHLNNGEPAALMRWLDSLELRAGERLLHVGCGVGYYTAVAAEALRPGGHATGVEIDPVLAERALRNTAPYGDIEIHAGDGSKLVDRGFDAIYVNAGATEIPPAWLDSLAPGGRLLLPLTVSIPGVNAGAGWMLLVRRDAQGYTAEFRGPVGIFHCAGARSDAGEERLRRLYTAGAPPGIRRLRRDPHPESAGCALHGDGFCLSQP
jgi:protein-L-isoaspartate(D-aspartate) O-methyltransferase